MADRLQRHPTFNVLEAAALADAVAIDDRSLNQYTVMNIVSGPKPVLTTFDVITETSYQAAQRREHLTALRRAAFAFVPVTTEELVDLVEQAVVYDGRLMESAELKALRENIQVVRMWNGLQFPKEHVWLNNLMRSFSEAIKAQWREGMDEEGALVRANWLLAQIDIRQWAHRYKVDKHPEVGEDLYRNQILALAIVDPAVPQKVKEKYWVWLDEVLLTTIQSEQRELYGSIIQRVKESLFNAYELGFRGE